MRPLFEGWQLKSPFPIARRRRIYLYRRTRGGGTGSTGRPAGHSATYLADTDRQTWRGASDRDGRHYHVQNANLDILSKSNLN